jgi:hypothetical protein
MQNLMKMRRRGAELCHVTRQAEITKLIVDFRNFAKASKK